MAQRLLLADDSITIQKVVELVLAEEDFEIKAVSNGEDALAAVGTFRPDIVLADIEMPKMNGYQLCEHIKQDPETACIPVILLAGAFEPIDEELSASVGADDSIIKPFESQELISKINAALTMASATGEGAFAEVEAEPETGAFELAGEAGGEEAEAIEVAGIDEDLWAMEEVEAVAATAEEEVLEEAGLNTAFAFPEEEVALRQAPAAEFAEKPMVRAEVAVPEAAIPSKEEFLSVFEKSVNARVPAIMQSLDIRDTVVSAITPILRESVEKIIKEIAPDLVEKILREVMRESMTTLKGEVEKVLWETVPDLAGTLISREIEKIRAEA
jgi:CheY-like chemotaxis protein